LKRSKDKTFSWKDYQEVQNLVETAKIVETTEGKTGHRTVGWAKSGERHYVVVWEAEHETDRNVLVSLYPISANADWRSESAAAGVGPAQKKKSEGWCSLRAAPETAYCV